ncbi:hypothetical protein EXIGLDRAFT_237910 [Exidia glandulosa HHB12029]|uniref:Uncharacterized protein n=1 Tax=Exidia glandulosa HHB12029 TaxID=1314781 RepID=A0A165E034_EXIGL|nr:hypothetical protein EXIGLDRAFT_237910 [Exidia glandulosa HHB12029]
MALPPPLTLHLPPPGNFLLAASSPVSSPASPAFDSPPATARISPGRKRRATRTSRTSRVSLSAAPNRDSVMTTCSIPVFAPCTPKPARPLVEEEEPTSPTLMYPLQPRVPGVRHGPTMQTVKHVIEAETETEDDFGGAFPMPKTTPTLDTAAKARKRLGLDENDNVVEIVEADAGWRPAALTYIRQVRPPPPQKKSTFNVRKLFTRRR